MNVISDGICALSQEQIRIKVEYRLKMLLLRNSCKRMDISDGKFFVRKLCIGVYAVRKRYRYVLYINDTFCQPLITKDFLTFLGKHKVKSGRHPITCVKYLPARLHL